MEKSANFSNYVKIQVLKCCDIESFDAIFETYLCAYKLEASLESNFGP